MQNVTLASAPQTPVTRTGNTVKPDFQETVNAFRDQQYQGPTPVWPDRAARRRNPSTAAGRWLPLAAAACAVVVLASLLGQPDPSQPSNFGKDFKPNPSAYSALREIRQTLPDAAVGASATLAPGRLPPRPRRPGGFQPEMNEAQRQPHGSSNQRLAGDPGHSLTGNTHHNLTRA